ncbi:UNVERIFIED_CONTAM: Ribosomal RNA processing protein 1B [Sesamum radiatum]|uniref:Ribosomal RNA processing protein 1B n=1 Tax=Sesamum radiatum TaxID=300843 RepID=A0AAW2NR84_SESRA
MKKRPREPKPLLPFLASATGPALIKHLASCNTTVRSQSLRLLQSWLASESEQLSDSDIKKLWKGLFYCLWHADKTPNQLALINRLTNLFLSLQPSLSLEFFRGFLVTLRREWPGIDRLRLDKFYLLIRRFVKALFELMRLRKWDVDVLGEYLGVLENDGFLAEDKLQGNGVNYQVASVFLEELKGVGFPVRKEVVDVIFGPFLSVMMRSKDKILLGKVKSCLFDELVKLGKELLAKKRTGVGCDEKDANRKVVLGLHEEFLKLEKDLESSGVQIGIPEYSNAGDCADDDEVPQLIPIDYDASKSNEETRTQEGADNAFKKKNKKAKKGVDGDDKKRKKKKKRKDENGVAKDNSAAEENGNLDMVNGTENLYLHIGSENSPSNDLEIDGTSVDLNETVILNLQKQFEKVATEIGSESDEGSDFSDTPLVSKRKRTKGADVQEPANPNTNSTRDGGDAARSVEKSAKKVRFAMKNNLVWKPQTPLPPESLRLPPSVTPRGSALKKGVPPGPIIEMPSVMKKAKQKKKALNRLKSATPLMKRRKKMQTRSA